MHNIVKHRTTRPQSLIQALRESARRVKRAGMIGVSVVAIGSAIVLGSSHPAASAVSHHAVSVAGPVASGTNVPCGGISGPC